jgi:hypothetical protein
MQNIWFGCPEETASHSLRGRERLAQISQGLHDFPVKPCVRSCRVVPRPSQYLKLKRNSQAQIVALRPGGPHPPLAMLSDSLVTCCNGQFYVDMNVWACLRKFVLKDRSLAHSFDQKPIAFGGV